MSSKNILKINFSAFCVIVIFLQFPGCGERREEVRQQAPVRTSISASESIVREGIINLTFLDKNKDGKLFECPMDYNVIDDKSGSCTKCGMDLEEMTIKKVKENLVKNGFKVK